MLKSKFLTISIIIPLFLLAQSNTDTLILKRMHYRNDSLISNYEIKEVFTKTDYNHWIGYWMDGLRERMDQKLKPTDYLEYQIITYNKTSLTFKTSYTYDQIDFFIHSELYDSYNDESFYDFYWNKGLKLDNCDCYKYYSKDVLGNQKPSEKIDCDKIKK
jgi:hypothetical protein